MPGRDQTGPVGTGPNGRGLGPCRDENDNNARSGFFGRRRGGRRGGWRGRFQPPWAGWGQNQPSLEQEEQYLKKRLAEVQEQLKK